MTMSEMTMSENVQPRSRWRLTLGRDSDFGQYERHFGGDGEAHDEGANLALGHAAKTVAAAARRRAEKSQSEPAREGRARSFVRRSMLPDGGALHPRQTLH
jgi:hypothetical protein